MPDYMEHRIVAENIGFPEGPIWNSDGSMLFVDIQGGTLSALESCGATKIVANLGGGPNGAALGPDGRCYVCNNGGFNWHSDATGRSRPIGQSDTYSGGRIEAVDLKTGSVESLYTHCNALSLQGPNDLVFDRHGGFYFTDMGKVRADTMDRGAVYYALPDGRSIKRIGFPLVTPNGIGLSPDETTLYVSETLTGRLWAFDLKEPGQVLQRPYPSPNGGRVVATSSGLRNLDSLAVQADGKVCVATLLDGGISVIDPDTGSVEHYPLPDPYYVTNICFGGQDYETAYVTQSWQSNLIAIPWPSPGLKPNFSQ